jgi:hypothetical protein
MTQDLYYKEGVGVVSRAQITDLHKGMSLPSSFDAEFSAWLGYVPVEIQQPIAETELQYPVAFDRLENGVFIKGWKLVDKPASAIADRNARKAAAADLLEVKDDPAIVVLLKKNPTALDQYIETQVTDLASTKQVLKLLLKLLIVTVR